MIDLHCHILPGLDDGPDGMDEAIAMAQSAIADGITHVVATPHASNEYFFNFELIQRRRDEVLAELHARTGLQLHLGTGCDFHLNPENLEALRVKPTDFCINQKSYLLVEFNEFSIPPAMDQTLHQIQLAGIRTIITHPERNGILRAHPERLRNWVRIGSFVQVTGGALTGGFGQGSQKDALQWIGEGLVHFVASDAHGVKRRPLQLRAAFDLVAESFGQEKAQALFVENPLAAFEGWELPHIPEVVEEIAPKKKRFFLF